MKTSRQEAFSDEIPSHLPLSLLGMLICNFNSTNGLQSSFPAINTLINNQVTWTCMSTWKLFRSPCHCKDALKMYIMWFVFSCLHIQRASETRKFSAVWSTKKASWSLMIITCNRKWVRNLQWGVDYTCYCVVLTERTTCLMLPLSSALKHLTHMLTHAPSSFTESLLPAPESFIFKLLERLVSSRIALWTSQSVNMSNTSVNVQEIICGYSVRTIMGATPVLLLLKAQWV